MTAAPSMLRAVTAALKDAQTLPRDAGTIALAKRYARLIDEAQQLADALAAIVPETDAQARRLATLSAAVEAHTVASDLGPKLLAALDKLLMTPAGRGAKGGSGASPIAARLDEFTARRLGRDAS